MLALDGMARGGVALRGVLRGLLNETSRSVQSGESVAALRGGMRASVALTAQQAEGKAARGVEACSVQRASKDAWWQRASLQRARLQGKRVYRQA